MDCIAISSGLHAIEYEPFMLTAVKWEPWHRSNREGTPPSYACAGKDHLSGCIGTRFPGLRTLDLDKTTRPGLPVTLVVSQNILTRILVVVLAILVSAEASQQSGKNGDHLIQQTTGNKGRQGCPDDHQSGEGEPQGCQEGRHFQET